MNPRPQDMKEILKRSQKDPDWWISNVLGDKLWDVQKKIAESVRDNDETSVAACHGPGKSFLAARLALWFLCSFPPALVLTTAPTERQVKGILWKELTLAYKGAKIPLGGKLLTLGLQLDTDWYAMGFTAPDYDPNRFQGFHEENILVIVDEACGVSQTIMNGIDGVLSSQHSRKLSIGNPVDPTSAFAKDFKRADVSKFYISVFDTPNFTAFGITEEDLANNTWEDKITGPLPNPKLVTPKWAYKMYRKAGLTSPFYISRVRGQWPEQGTDTLIPLDKIVEAQNRTLEPSTPIEVSLDVARFGDDESVFGVRRGPVSRILETTSKEDLMQTTGRLVNHRRATGAERAKVDPIGVGAGVVDRMNELGEPVVEVNASGAPIDRERFLNVRAEMYWNLRELFINDEIDIDEEDEEQAAQLSNLKYKFSSRGKVQIESKEEIKKRTGISPDRADRLAIQFYSPEGDVLKILQQLSTGA